MNLEKYGYYGLPLEQQVLYKKIKEALSRHKEYIFCKDEEFSKEKYITVLRTVCLENPQFFYAHPETVIFEKTSWGLSKVKFNYFYSKAEKSEIEKELNFIKGNLLSEINEDTGEVIRFLHDQLIQHIVLSEESNMTVGDMTIVGALLEGKTSSRGMALAFKYLLNAINIKCDVICGYIIMNNGTLVNRFWNIVELYGTKQHFDLYENALRSTDMGISYDYFGVPNQQIWKDHHIESMNENEFSVKKEASNHVSLIKDMDIDDINAIDLTKGIDIETGMNFLRKIPSRYMSDNLKEKLNTQINKIDNILRLHSQYEIGNEIFIDYIEKYLPEQIGFLQEYCRYKEYSASPVIMQMLNNRMMEFIDNFINELQKKLDNYWKSQSNDMMNDIGDIQKKLIQRRMKRMEFPFNLSEIEDEMDINKYLEVYNYLLKFDLPHDFLVQLHNIISGLCEMKEILERNNESSKEILEFITYYLMEPIKLILDYDKYQVLGVDKMILDDIGSKIENSLENVKKAIYNKIKSIHMMDAIYTKAKAYALSDLLGRDGYL